jgi:hypothetical protein
MNFKTILFFLILILAQPVYSQCTSPTASNGQMMWVSGASQVQYCRGTSWVAMNNTNTGTACSIAGAISYVSSEIVWCNGSNWMRTTGSSAEGSCSGGQAGYFYYDVGGSSWYGNLSYYWFCNGSAWRKMP